MGGGGSNWQIYEDPADGAAGGGENLAPEKWEIGSAAQRRKENAGEVVAMAGQTLAQKRGVGAPPPPAAATFSVFVDEELQNADGSGDNDDAPAAPRSMRLQLDGPASQAPTDAEVLRSNPLRRFPAPPPRADDEPPTPADAADARRRRAARRRRSAAAGGAKPAPVDGYDASLLVLPDGEESSFEEARARRRHGYGAPKPAPLAPLAPSAAASPPLPPPSEPLPADELRHDDGMTMHSKPRGRSSPAPLETATTLAPPTTTRRRRRRRRRRRPRRRR